MGGYRAATLSAKGRLPWTGRSGALLVTASGVEAGVAIDTLRLDARGAVEALQLDGSARSELGALEFAGNADKRGANWQGTLRRCSSRRTRARRGACSRRRATR